MRLGLGCTALLFLAISLAACSTRVTEPTGCTRTPECGAGAYCRDGSCVASQAPVARLAAPEGPLFSHLAHHLDGSGSSDPDPGDAVVGYSWTAARVEGSCEPVHTTGGDATFDLLVTCAGTFEVSLVVTDSYGVDSAPAVARVAVEAQSTPPTVSIAGPDLAEHSCSGNPLRCTPVVGSEGATTFTLQGSATSPTPGPLAWRWSANPPAELVPAPRVTLSPAGEGAVSVAIETDGTAIAGEYALAVEVTDAAGLTTGARHLIRVGNRPPVLAGAGGLLSIPHSYDASQGLYLARQAIPSPEVIDPDGDPVTVQFAGEEQGIAGSTMVVSPAGTGALVEIRVPGNEPASLIGEGISRRVGLVARDTHGASSAATWEVSVENRPPHRVGTFFNLSVSHRFDAAASTYSATVELASYVDDDGDPLQPFGATGSSVCPVLALSGGILQAACSSAYGSTPAANGLVGSHRLAVQVADPWAASQPETATARVVNHTPAASAPSVAISCHRHCCYEYNGTCYSPNSGWYARSGTVLVTVSDLDGEPLGVSYDGSSPGSVLCAAGSCTVEVAYSAPETDTCVDQAWDIAVHVDVTDGAETTTLRIPLRGPANCAY